jgi:hypothetical protein
MTIGHSRHRRNRCPDCDGQKDARSVLCRECRTDPRRRIHRWSAMSSISSVEAGCWEWLGERHKGYGRIRVNGRQQQAHRVSYEAFIGPIPDGLTIDHLCGNPACVNPEHLEAVSLRENIMRGSSPTAIAHKTDTCKRGHSLLGDNVYWQALRTGQRVRACKACRALRNREYRARKRVSS